MRIGYHCSANYYNCGQKNDYELITSLRGWLASFQGPYTALPLLCIILNTNRSEVWEGGQDVIAPLFLIASMYIP